MQNTMLKYVTDAGRLYQQLLAPVRASTGLTQAELDILLFLANNPEYDTASDIVALRRLAKSNVSVGIKHLESMGFIRRCPDEKDRRVEHLSLTPTAGPAIEQGRRGQEEFGKILMGNFTEEERGELKRLMGRIQQNLTRALDTLPQK